MGNSTCYAREKQRVGRGTSYASVAISYMKNIKSDSYLTPYNNNLDV